MSFDRRFGVLLSATGLICSIHVGCSSAGNDSSGTPGAQVAGPNTPGTPSGSVQNGQPGAGSAGSTAPAPTGTGDTTGTTGTNPVPATGTGGTGDMTATTPNTGSTGGSGSSMPTGTTTMPVPGAPMAMDECGLHTKYAGDEYCILPPPPDQGFQIHIGPSNYDNPEPQYILAPGQEITSDFPATSSNTEPRYFYYRQIRMRPGAHHNITTKTAGGVFGMGSRIATSNNLSEDNPKGGIIAPENEDVGIPMDPMSGVNVNLHSINTTDQDELREIWINFWYIDSSKVKEPVQEVFQVGDPLLAVQPGADTILGPYTCTTSAAGRVLWLYGHRHANNVQFSVWRVRGGQRDLIYDAFNWEDPLVLEYSSTVTNTTPDVPNGIEGGWSGILDLQAGDQIQWQCHVINNQPTVLRFTNNTYSGEMCIVDAEMVGTNCN